MLKGVSAAAWCLGEDPEGRGTEPNLGPQRLEQSSPPPCLLLDQDFCLTAWEGSQTQFQRGEAGGGTSVPHNQQTQYC